MLKIKFAASDVEDLVHFYWPDQSDRMRQIERNLESLAPHIRSRQFLTREEFRLICSWTAIRAVNLYKRNTEAAVEEITARAFAADGESQRIDILTQLVGVEHPTATTILHYFHSDIYPIWSIPAGWSVNADFKSYSFYAWWEYVKYFRELVAEWKVSPRDLDRALWEFHYVKTAREVPYSDDA